MSSLIRCWALSIDRTQFNKHEYQLQHLNGHQTTKSNHDTISSFFWKSGKSPYFHLLLWAFFVVDIFRANEMEFQWEIADQTFFVVVPIAKKAVERRSVLLLSFFVVNFSLWSLNFHVIEYIIISIWICCFGFILSAFCSISSFFLIFMPNWTHLHVRIFLRYFNIHENKKTSENTSWKWPISNSSINICPFPPTSLST